MKNYPVPMVPGPVKVPEDILEICRTDFGAPGLESGFFDLYAQTESRLKQILGTKNPVVIQTGEGMLALWSALKSCLVPGDRVLSVATGVFGYGIAEMAKSVGAEVKIIGLGYDQTLGDLSGVEQAIAEFKPKMITVVHCETPSGTLNPIEGLGRLKQKYNVPLLYADVVSSAGGAPVLSDEWAVDLALCGVQKCLSAPPGMCFLSVSQTAWEIVKSVNYAGYDALKPFRDAQKNRRFPYTPYWHGVAALNRAAERLLTEGLDAVYARHQTVAQYCRKQLVETGFSLFPAPDAVQSPTVTAVNIPANTTWPELDARLREKGLVVGGSHGPLAGRVFRLGHMGSQADMGLIKQALDILAAVVRF